MPHDIICHTAQYMVWRVGFNSHLVKFILSWLHSAFLSYPLICSFIPATPYLLITSPTQYLGIFIQGKMSNKLTFSQICKGRLFKSRCTKRTKIYLIFLAYFKKKPAAHLHFCLFNSDLVWSSEKK